jgi:hypothetical protein
MTFKKACEARLIMHSMIPALLVLTGCGINRATTPWGTDTVETGQKWTKSFVNTGGDHEGKVTWEVLSGGNVNVYILTEAEWNKWTAGASPESLSIAGKTMGTNKGEMALTSKGHTTYVLVFENIGTAPAKVKWKAS